MIDKENPDPRGYKIPGFSFFSREDGQSTLEHVARFTIQCGELANYENFYHFKLRLFPKLFDKGNIHLVYNIIKELHLKLAGDGKAVPHSVLQG